MTKDVNSAEPASGDAAGPPERAKRRPTGSTQRILAGFLTIIAGLMALVNGLTTLLNETSFRWLDIDMALNEFSVCGAMVIIFGVVAVAGGVSAIRGRNLSLALAGAGMGMIGDGIWGFALGLVAFVLLFMSEEDI